MPCQVHTREDIEYNEETQRHAALAVDLLCKLLRRNRDLHSVPNGLRTDLLAWYDLHTERDRRACLEDLRNRLSGEDWNLLIDPSTEITQEEAAVLDAWRKEQGLEPRKPTRTRADVMSQLTDRERELVFGDKP